MVLLLASQIDFTYQDKVVYWNDTERDYTLRIDIYS